MPGKGVEGQKIGDEGMRYALAVGAETFRMNSDECSTAPNYRGANAGGALRA